MLSWCLLHVLFWKCEGSVNDPKLLVVRPFTNFKRQARSSVSTLFIKPRKERDFTMQCAVTEAAMFISVVESETICIDNRINAERHNV